jgi:hypothetical protein
VSHPTVWPQPIPMLARLAPETGALRLKTSMLLLPRVLFSADYLLFD